MKKWKNYVQNKTNQMGQGDEEAEKNCLKRLKTPPY